MKYVNVVIDNNSRHTDSLFTYKAEDDVKVGARVKVPFNKGNSLKTAYVFQTDVSPDYDENRVKEVFSVDPDIALNEEIIETCKWMKRRYGIKYIDAISCFVPKGKPAKAGKEKEPYKDEEGEKQSIESLTEEQNNCVEIINHAICENLQENYLIHGVTGSGKTEVYMQVIAKTLEEGKSAIMLVPEIALTKQIIDRFIGRFGKEKIAVLHSKLTGRERFDEWMRIKRGEAKIVIGARLGVFAPVENLGVVILDEEHEATYKSDMTPKYDTVDIALKRLMYYNGVLILGSATPSVVSYSRAQEGIYKLIELKQRYNQNPLPKVELIDMKEELKHGNLSVFSDRLYQKMNECLLKGMQVILFLNRRGYSTFLSCESCGEVMKCPECGISLTYHKKENACICHYCGKKYSVNTPCPTCGSEFIKFSGSGTEKIEEVTREMFPGATVERLDLDTAKNNREINRIVNSFSKGKTDILVGTQLVAKGLDFKNVGLVGVISADVSLNIPDFRSTERTFQLVTQVAGRAGRGDKEGLVVVQTFSPENYALTTAANHDYHSFYKEELMLRNLMDYPPFTDLIMVEFTSEDEALALGIAEKCKEYLHKCKVEDGNETIFSPKISSSFKGKDSYRYYILIKSPKGYRNKYVFYVESFIGNVLKNKINCNVLIDVNPYTIF